MYGSWDVEHKDSFVILDNFFRFHSTDNPENKHLKTWKKYLEVLSFYTSVP